MRGFALFLACLLILALLLRTAVFFTIVYFVIALYVLSRLWVRYVMEHVTLRRRFDDRAFTGDEVPVSLLITNTARVPVPWLQITESVPLDLELSPLPPQVLTLGPRQQHVFTYRLTCRKRGYYTLGPLYFEGGDLLGIEQKQFTWNQQDRILVYPKVLSLSRLRLRALSAQAVVPTASPLLEDPARITGVRDYQPGDSPRRIHWTATARLSRLTVKQYEPSIARETMIFLDLNGDDYEQRERNDATELGIVAAASLANHIIVREGLPAGLATRAGDPFVGEVRHIILPPRSERSQLLGILEVLARVQMTRGGDFADALRRASVGLPWGASVLAITGCIGEQLLATLLYLRRGGFAVSLLLVRPAGGTQAVGSASGHIPTHVIMNERDVEVWA